MAQNNWHAVLEVVSWRHETVWFDDEVTFDCCGAEVYIALIKKDEESAEECVGTIA